MVRPMLVTHDYLVQSGGAERVAILLAEHFGEGSMTTTTFSPSTTHRVPDSVQVKELLPNLPQFAKQSRAALAPLAAAAFLRAAPTDEVMLASTSGWSHWMESTAPTVVYCHTPPRWLWAPEDYFSTLPRPVRALADRMGAPLRKVDRARARNRTLYIANSSVVRERIRASYGIDPLVIHPPASFTPDGPEDAIEGLSPGFVLTVGRSRGYKNGAHARNAFTGGELGQLVMVGGDKGSANDGPVVELGKVTDPQLRWLYRNCRAVLALSHEDFGLTPVEGHAFGKPTVALRAGGYLDSCLEGVNAIFTDSMDTQSVRRAIAQLDRNKFDSNRIVATADRFAVDTFIGSIREATDRAASLVA